MALNEGLVLAIKNDFVARLREKNLLSQEKELDSTVDLNKEFFDYLVEEQYYDFEYIQAVAEKIQRDSFIKGDKVYDVTDEIITMEFEKRLDHNKLKKEVNDFKRWIKSLNKRDLRKSEFSNDGKKYCHEKVLWYFLTKKANLAHIQGYVGFCAFVGKLKDQALILNVKKNQVFPPSLETFKPHFEEAKKRTKDCIELEKVLEEVGEKIFPRSSNVLSVVVIACVLMSNIGRYLISSNNSMPKPILNCWDGEIGNHQWLNLLCDTSAYPILEKCVNQNNAFSCAESFIHRTNGTMEISLWRDKQNAQSSMAPHFCTLDTFFHCANENFSGNFQQSQYRHLMTLRK